MEREHGKGFLADQTQAEHAVRPAAPTNIPNAAKPTERSDPAQRRSGEDLLAALQRVEEVVKDIRGRLEGMGEWVETTTRERRHRQFSAAWLIGSLLQALVIGFVVAALADWAFEAELGRQLVKLALAGVLQLGALTAFVLARGAGN